MARYVDANKLQAKYDKMLNDFLKMGISIGAAAIKHALKEIDDMPSADVRPERHGEWLVSGECYECSECGGGSTVNTNPFCWKCGAKMRGKENKNG